MIDVLMYLYESYWRPEACPPPEVLARKLCTAGFEEEEVTQALAWLGQLAVFASMSQTDAKANADANANANAATVSTPGRNQSSRRVYAAPEQLALGVEGINLLAAIDTQGKISPQIRELLIDQALASGNSPLDVDDLRVMLLIVYWCLDEEPDQLLLDELFEDPDAPRTYH
jgi:Smg protein